MEDKNFESPVIDNRIVKLNEIIGIKLSSINSKKRPAVKEAKELARYILNEWDNENALSDLLLFKNVSDEKLKEIVSSRSQELRRRKEGDVIR